MAKVIDSLLLIDEEKNNLNNDMKNSNNNSNNNNINNYALLYSNANASIFIDINGEPIRPDDNLLKICLLNSHVDKLLSMNVTTKNFANNGNSSTYDFDVLNVIVASLFNSLNNVLLVLMNESEMSNANVNIRKDVNKHQNIENNSKDVKHKNSNKKEDILNKNNKNNLIESTISTKNEKNLLGDSEVCDEEEYFLQHLKTSNFSFFASNVACELDAVVILEWLSNLLFSSNQTLNFFWNKIYGFY
jgi:hypothetical protein